MDGRPVISVLVVSCRGIDAVSRVLDTVASQDVEADLNVTIIGDNPAWSPDDIPVQNNSSMKINAIGVATNEGWKNAPAVFRVSRLRNIALEYSTGDYVCFLDDDNSWEKKHLASLLSEIQSTGFLAAYSWRQLVDEQDNPWRENSFPWGRDQERKQQIYQLLVQHGIMNPKGNVFRDDHRFSGISSGVGLVDMGAWMLHRSVFDRMRFRTSYSELDILDSITEDDKFLKDFLTLGFDAVCTKLPTLIYRLGGYSNKEH